MTDARHRGEALGKLRMRRPTWPDLHLNPMPRVASRLPGPSITGSRPRIQLRPRRAGSRWCEVSPNSRISSRTSRKASPPSCGALSSVRLPFRLAANVAKLPKLPKLLQKK